MLVNKFSIRTNFPLVLASKSNIRKRLLKSVGLKFKVAPSSVDEDKIKMKYRNKSFKFIASKLANEKAKAISKIYKDTYVIGADQICVCKKKSLSKPKTIKNALQQLTFMNGLEHKQITAFSIYFNNRLVSNYCDTAILKMRKLSKKNIRTYVEDDLPLNSCGSYKFESKGVLLFSSIIGSVNTIKGLPLLPLLEVLHKKKIIKYV